MINKILALKSEATSKINEAKNINELNETKALYLGKKSPIQEIMSKMREFTPEEKKEIGMKVNEFKVFVEEAVSKRLEQINEEEVNKKLQSEAIDVTLPGKKFVKGNMHVLSKSIEEMEDIFIGMGYEIAEGPEVESDHFNFELLNVPKDHPARDMQDSFFIDETHLMRSQTSPVQAHVMLEANGRGPIKIISPGKVYRRDDDATHSHQFGQIEGLVIDEHISMSNLMGTLDLFAKKMFGDKREIRMRPSYFPFTEPSVEVDISCFECGGKGCSLCKGSGWIEILGAGMVHPNVLSMCGFDTKIYQGFAFGIGIERVAMLRYGIDDIRKFYNNDLRFNDQFHKE